jgi:methylated-DNA-[protein]-cysteine S-methyltransferase
MELTRASLATPIGTIEVAIAREGVKVLGLPDSRGDADAIRRIEREATGRGASERCAERVLGWLRDYFEGDLTALARIPVAPEGTPFQKRVWEELRRIPVGTTLSYRDLAVAIGQPSAFRAVALANARNPVALAIPCHRVIGSDGTLVGYGGGLPRKRWLLEHEGALPRSLGGSFLPSEARAPGARARSRRGAAPASPPRTPPPIR